MVHVGLSPFLHKPLERKDFVELHGEIIVPRE
jgi:hypothetical protein